MNERLNRFISLLKQIFELDKSDLDFGIYRVMNLRKAQIEEFLTERLPQMVQETLAPFAQGSKEEIRVRNGHDCGCAPRYCSEEAAVFAAPEAACGRC